MTENVKKEKKEFDPVYILKKPITLGDRTIEKVTIEEPAASSLAGVKMSLPASKDIKTLDIDVDTALAVVSVCCTSLTPPEVGKMKLVDITGIYWKCIDLFFN